MRRAGESLQLALLLRVSAPNGAARTLRVLVDTGAQIHLVKHDLFEMRPVRSKFRFASVDGSAIQGGDSVQTLSLALVPPDSKGTESASVVDGQRTRTGSASPPPAGMFNLVDNFWAADIRADIILSYPSLLRHLLGVIPHCGCLLREEAPLAFQLLGDGRPSEWIHPDPKERGAQLQNVSAIELRRLLDSYYQPAGTGAPTTSTCQPDSSCRQPRTVCGGCQHTCSAERGSAP